MGSGEAEGTGTCGQSPGGEAVMPRRISSRVWSNAMLCVCRVGFRKLGREELLASTWAERCLKANYQDDKASWTPWHWMEIKEGHFLGVG